MISNAGSPFDTFRVFFTQEVAANLIRLLAYQNKVCSIAFQHRLLKHSFTFLIDKHLVSEFDVKLLLNYKMNVCY